MKTCRAPFLPVLFLALIAAGCTSVAPPSSALAEQEWVDPDASASQLRVRMFEFYVRFSAAIENVADEIIATSEDREVRRAALQWKIDALTEAQVAAFRSDPLGAFIDCWTFCAQMEAYLTDGDGKDLFGAEQETVRAVTAQMESEIGDIGRAIARDGDLSLLVPEVENVVHKYPIKGSLSLRRAPLEEYAHLIRGASSLSEIAADVNQQVADLSRRLTYYAARLPRQARWEAELLVDDHLETLVSAIDRMAGVLEEMPEIVDAQRLEVSELVRDEREIVLATAVEAVARERGALTEAVSSQLAVVLEAANGQRVETIQAMVDERLAVIEALKEERMVIVDAIGTERQEVVRVLREERRQAMEDVEAIGNRLLNASVPPVEGLIDHFFLRLVLVLGAIVLVGAVLGLIGLRIYRAPRPGPDAVA